MASGKEETLAVKTEKAASRLKAATGYMVGAAEPMHVIQKLAWQVHMIRAEMTTLRDIMRAKGVLDTDEYQKRAVDEMSQYVSLIEDAAGIHVSDDGKFVTITKGFETKKGGEKLF